MPAPHTRAALLRVPAAAPAIGGPAAPQAGAAAPAHTARQDVNGDGCQDLVTGAPAGTVGGRAGAGCVLAFGPIAVGAPSAKAAFG